MSPCRSGRGNSYLAVRALRGTSSLILWSCSPKPPSNTPDWVSSWDGAPMGWSMFIIFMRATKSFGMWRVPADLPGMDVRKRCLNALIPNEWNPWISHQQTFLQHPWPSVLMEWCTIHGLGWSPNIPSVPGLHQHHYNAVVAAGFAPYRCLFGIVLIRMIFNCFEGLFALSLPPLKELRWHSWSSHPPPPSLSQLFIMQHHQDCSQTRLVSYKRHWQILLVDRRVVVCCFFFSFLLKILKSHFSLET